MIYFSLINWHNLDLLSVGLAIAAIGILGGIAFFDNPKSITNRAFLWFAIMTTVYGIFNYLNYQVKSPELILWFLRLTIFSAVWHAFSFYFLFYVFPKNETTISRFNKFFIIPLTILVSILTLTPLVFSKVIVVASSGVSNPQRGRAIALFGMTTLFLVVSGIVELIKKTKRASSGEKKEFFIILLGTIVTFSLIAIFNVLLPVVFNNTRFVPLAPVFILPFIACTAYGIVEYHLFNVKVIATEGLTFLLTVALLFELLLSENFAATLFRFFIFFLVLLVGILLIRSVQKEVLQREQLQKLSKELEVANEQLKALDQARADFITIASHQLRTPPATIKWYLSAIKSGDYGKLPDDAATALARTEATNNSLIALIDDLLNASRIERGKMEFNFVDTDTQEIAQVTVDQLQPIAQMKNLKLAFEKPSSPLPHIMADKEKLRQVMNNFIDNAIKYTKEGGVTAKINSDGTTIRFEVTDTGKGIAPELRDSLFDKYTRGKDSATHATGLGLGLYVAKFIIDTHHGKIWAESPGEGKGSTFIFTIPIKNNLEGTSTLDLSDQKMAELSQ